MLFSHVKISSFRAKAHLLFHWCLYNKGSYHLRWWGDLTSFTSWHGSFDQRKARICELYQFRSLLHGEKLSLSEGTLPYSSHPERVNFSYSSLQKMVNRSHERQKVGSARRVTVQLGDPPSQANFSPYKYFRSPSCVNSVKARQSEHARALLPSLLPVTDFLHIN